VEPFFDRAYQLRDSTNATERESVFLGTLLADGSPLLAHEKSFSEHLYIRGSPGSGKSAVIAYLCELRLSRGGCVMHVFDLKKGGTRELLAALQAGAARSGTPVRWFVDLVGRSTHTFNLFLQGFFQAYAPMEMADFVGAALGSSHGLEGYGKQHFGSIAVRVLFEVFRRWQVGSWVELDGCIDAVLSSPPAHGLDRTTVLGATQLRNDVHRLAQIPALNHPTSTIDLGSDEPQAVYWSFPRKYATAGAICRMALYGNFAAADMGPKTNRIIVVDEFQRVVGNQLDLLFTQGRESIQLILANQGLSDLKTRDKDYAPTVQTCCRMHWTFNASDPAEQLFMAETSGKVTRKRKTTTYAIGPLGLVSGESRSYAEVEADRYGLNDVKLASATPDLSLFCCAQDHGFIQYGGFPQVVHTRFHISQDEHGRRKALPWPGPDDGTITGEMPPPLPPPGPRPPRSPIIINEPRKTPRRAPKDPGP
jgi:hypothetical protein